MTDTESIVIDKGIQANLFGSTWEVDSIRKGKIIKPRLEDYAKDNKINIQEGD
jgi:hypothetical protein